jgi:hypothetical protein
VKKVLFIINKNSEGNIIGESFNGEARKASPAISYGLASTSSYAQPQGVITILIYLELH